MVTTGGHQAMGRQGGTIRIGALADLVALNTDTLDLISITGDCILDSLVVAGDNRMISEVWSAGRHMVTGGRHIYHDAIRARYAKQVQHLRQMKLS